MMTSPARPAAGAGPEPDVDFLNPDHHWELFIHATAEARSAYFYRGIAQENQNLINLIGADFSVTIWQDDNAKFLNRVALDWGLQSDHYFGPSGGERATTNVKFVELEWYGGISAQVLDRWTFAIYPRQRTSVSGRTPSLRGDVHSFEMWLEFDDRTPAYDWKLSPRAMISIEYEGQSDQGTNHGGRTSAYLELGVRPVFEVYRLGAGRIPVTLAVPLTLGFSLSEYYESPVTEQDDFFGFFDVGLELEVPIKAYATTDPSHAFVFSLTGELHVLFLGDSAQDLSLAHGAGGDDVEVIAVLGFNVTY